MAQIPYNVQGINDVQRLQQELLKNGNIQGASQASLLLNQYAKDMLVPDTIGSLYSNYYNNLFQPSNKNYEQILSSVDKDYKTKIGGLFDESNAQYGSNGLLKKQMEDYYNNQAIATANRFGAQQSLNAALAAKQGLDPSQVNIGASTLASQQNDEMLKLRQGQMGALDNLTKTYLDFYNRYNDQYANSNDKYVVQTAQQLKQIRDALTNTALNQSLQKDMMNYQKSLTSKPVAIQSTSPEEVLLELQKEAIAKKQKEDELIKIQKLFANGKGPVSPFSGTNIDKAKGATK